MKPPREQPTAICVLGMHRSGTSTITRAVNLLGAYLGEEKLFNSGSDNPKGYWEHPDIHAAQMRLMSRLDREWNTVMPLPEGWHKSEAIRPVKNELTQLTAELFGDKPLWAWKDPKTCLLMPLWRDILEERDTKLSCVFVVRNPADVASSLAGRNAFQFNNGLGIWFHYNIVALKDTADLPMVFLSYERFLESWEPELRRCAAGLGLTWPKDEKKLRASMESFIDPTLRHNQAPPEQLQRLPAPVRELYQLLSDVCLGSTGRDALFDETVDRLSKEFHDYAALFEIPPAPPKPGRVTRTLHRWKKSIHKRLPKQER
jgi:hypothetical protein